VVEQSPISKPDAETSQQIARQCARLKSELSAEAEDLRRWGDEAARTPVSQAGARALSQLLMNVDELLGQMAGECGGEMERDEH
jgi:hypothetical protein